MFKICARTGSPEEQVGLGLMMVKRLMAAFGGLLRVSNANKDDQQHPPGALVELVFRAERKMGSITSVSTLCFFVFTSPQTK
jgi:K+-sensing histidine kinase KdpD